MGYVGLSIHRNAINIASETKKIIPFFLLHTPDLAYSFINNKQLDPDIFPLTCTPVRKFNGFEKIKEYYDKYSKRVTTQHKLKSACYPSSRVFDLLFRYPYYTYGKMSQGKPTKYILKRVL